MGSELMRIAEGFSIVAEGLRGLAKAEGGTKEKVVKTQPSATEKAQKPARHDHFCKVRIFITHGIHSSLKSASAVATTISCLLSDSGTKVTLPWGL